MLLRPTSPPAGPYIFRNWHLEFPISQNFHLRPSIWLTNRLIISIGLLETGKNLLGCYLLQQLHKSKHDFWFFLLELYRSKAGNCASLDQEQRNLTPKPNCQQPPLVSVITVLTRRPAKPQVSLTHPVGKDEILSSDGEEITKWWMEEKEKRWETSQSQQNQQASNFKPIRAFFWCLPK